MDTSPIIIHPLRHTSFQEAWDDQKSYLQALAEGRVDDRLLLLEHDPIITLGTSGAPSSIISSQESLKEKGVEVVKIERGGDVTYHGPGQLVVYPQVDLKKKKRDIGWYMRGLEEVVIRTLAQFDIVGNRAVGKTGVWIFHSELNAPNNSVDKKIASLGVKLSRWCTMHGFALNVRNCKSGFSVIHPCGFRNIEVTSIEEEKRGSPPALEEVAEEVTKHFLEVFSYYPSCSKLQEKQVHNDRK